MTWECGCGAVNRDLNVMCRACQTPGEMGRVPDRDKPPAVLWLKVLLSVLVGVGLIIVMIGIWIPSSPGVSTYSMVTHSIGLLEDYKKEHGTYPDNFEWFGFGKTEFCGDGKRAAGYRTYDENAEFTLSCYGRGVYIFSGVWEVYSSKTKEWRTISD